MKYGYLILDIETGLMDGWYEDLDFARDAFRSLIHRHPNRDWILVEALETPYSDGRPAIPEGRFHSGHPALKEVN